MISAGVEGRLPYMTYSEPWGTQPNKPPELFLRPAPKPLPASRYNGVSSPNGTRLAHQMPPTTRLLSKFPSPPTLSAPVNLTSIKSDEDDSQQYASYPPRFFPPYPHFPYGLYQQSPYLIPRNFPQTPLSPMETFSPTLPTSSAAFLSPSTFSPPAAKPGQSILKEKQTPPLQTQVAFKVPSGKEGSLKHRILTRPEDARVPLDLQKQPEGRKRLQATMSPPRSPKKPAFNNNTVAGNFKKGSLIQLVNGDLRKIEDMRTEDFLTSAAKCADLRLAESTVVKIDENSTGSATITLTYNDRQAKVEIESTQEHPYFIIRRGWASCNPEKTQHYYGLSVHRLQVGDVIVSLTPREPKCSTIMTTATTTSMTARQVNSTPRSQPHKARPPPALSPESLAARKRRWSAPDQICEEDERTARRQRVE